MGIRDKIMFGLYVWHQCMFCLLDASSVDKYYCALSFNISSLSSFKVSDQPGVENHLIFGLWFKSGDAHFPQDYITVRCCFNTGGQLLNAWFQHKQLSLTTWQWTGSLWPAAATQHLYLNDYRKKTRKLWIKRTNSCCEAKTVNDGEVDFVCVLYAFLGNHSA